MLAPVQGYRPSKLALCLGLLTFAGRARCELAATGETVRACTVGWHLRKIFIKLGLGSGREGRTVLDKVGPDRPAA